MRRPAGVDINLQRRIFLNQCAGRAGVIQVNVRQQNGVQVRDAKAMRLQPFAQSLQRGARAGVDQRVKIIGAKQRGGDAPGLPGPVQVQQSGGDP